MYKSAIFTRILQISMYIYPFTRNILVAEEEEEEGIRIQEEEEHRIQEEEEEELRMMEQLRQRNELAQG
jgi:KaiC/GvpD/RAD55 family RecA-like ATPase